jgi:hypothetical protein
MSTLIRSPRTSREIACLVEDCGLPQSLIHLNLQKAVDKQKIPESANPVRRRSKTCLPFHYVIFNIINGRFDYVAKTKE